MTSQEKNIAIAEFCGWIPETRKMYGGEKNVKGWGKNQHLSLGDKDRAFTSYPEAFPNYVGSLDAMHEAIVKLKEFDGCKSICNRYREFLLHLMQAMDPGATLWRMGYFIGSWSHA